MSDEQSMNLIRDAFRDVEGAAKADQVNWAMDAKLAALGISSISAVEMAGYLEERLDVQFPDDDLARVVTVADLVALVKRNAGGPA